MKKGVLNMALNMKQLYLKLEAIQKKCFKVLIFLALTLLVSVVLSIVFQVIYRNIIVKFFSFSFPFTEEFARIGIIWVSYLLLPVCLKEGRHASVTLIIDRLNQRKKALMYYIIQLISLTFYSVSFFSSFKNIMLNITYLSPSMRLPGPWIYASVTIGLGLAMLQIVLEVIGVISGELEPFYNIITDDIEQGGSV